jgi:hypothetical protein
MSAEWYFAKCKTCCEVKYFFVNDPIYTYKLFGEEKKATEIKQFFQKHYGCELVLGWRDDHLDQLWEEGYMNKDLKF